MFELTFRKKIFLSYLILFALFLALMYPYATQKVKEIIIQTMNDRTTELIEIIKEAPNDAELIKFLKDQKPQTFFRVGIITNDRKVLYDTHTRKLLGPEFTQEYIISHPEVLQAFAEGVGYHEEYSEILGQEFAYFAKTFPFQGKTYVIRTAFPFKYVSYVKTNFESAFFFFSTSILTLFSIVTWIVIYQLTKPINTIIQAIQPYEEGKLSTVPKIEVHGVSQKDEFGRLATTLNSLSARVQEQINDLTDETNERTAILNALTEGVIAINPDNTIAIANHMANELLKNGQELQDKNISELEPSIYDELVDACVREEQTMHAELVTKIENRRKFLDIIAIPTHHPHKAVLVIQDKTSQHQMMEMRKNFIANASHELKTPLTIVMGFAEALHDNPQLPEERKAEITGKIVHNIRRMTNLIKDLLILSDVENLPQSRVSETDLKELVSDYIPTIKKVFQEASVELEELSPGPYKVMADADLLILAFSNLMVNSCKYSEGPAEIKVSFSKEPKTVIVKFSDKGMGIPQSDQENIFQRFYTVDKAHSRKMGGSGLGLSIVETIIEKHGGTISLESEVGVGTTFTIVLPTQLENLI